MTTKIQRPRWLVLICIAHTLYQSASKGTAASARVSAPVMQPNLRAVCLNQAAFPTNPADSTHVLFIGKDQVQIIILEKSPCLHLFIVCCYICSQAPAKCAVSSRSSIILFKKKQNGAAIGTPLVMPHSTRGYTEQTFQSAAISICSLW